MQKKSIEDTKIEQWRKRKRSMSCGAQKKMPALWHKTVRSSPVDILLSDWDILYLSLLFEGREKHEERKRERE